MSEETTDPYLWLEDVAGEGALTWVRERNADTQTRLARGDRFETLRDEIRAVLDSDDRIPYPHRRGDHLYNFWQDADHPRGLWRRTTLDSYRGADPQWQVLLDVDALGAQESENWVWQGAAVLRPDFRRCLVQLSRGGADANVVREFDLDTLSFVDDGFTLPEAKSRVGWIDVDRIYVGTDFGPDSLTSSGYPRIIKEWRRGTPLTEAETVFEGKPDDVAVHASHDPTEGFERDFVDRTHRLLLRRVLPAHRRRRAGPDRRTPRRGRRRTPGLAAGPHPYAVDCRRDHPPCRCPAGRAVRRLHGRARPG